MKNLKFLNDYSVIAFDKWRFLPKISLEVFWKPTIKGLGYRSLGDIRRFPSVMLLFALDFLHFFTILHLTKICYVLLNLCPNLCLFQLLLQAFFLTAFMVVGCSDSLPVRWVLEPKSLSFFHERLSFFPRSLSFKVFCHFLNLGREMCSKYTK